MARFRLLWAVVVLAGFMHLTCWSCPHGASKSDNWRKKGMAASIIGLTGEAVLDFSHAIS